MPHAGGISSRRGKKEESGADRDRTGYLLVANQSLSQMSYGPAQKNWRLVERQVAFHVPKTAKSARITRARLAWASGRTKIRTSDLVLIRDAL